MLDENSILIPDEFVSKKIHYIFKKEKWVIREAPKNFTTSF